MSKKSASKSNSNELPETLADPKFAELRELLIKSAKETDKMWKKTELAHYFDGMNEAKRNQFAPFCLEWYKFLKKACPNEDSSKLPTFFPEKASVQHAFLAVKTAILACCAQKEIEKVFRENGASFLDNEFEIIMYSRRPSWLSDFLLWITRDTGLFDVGSDDYWRIYRRFIQENIVKSVKDDLWTRTMFTAITGSSIINHLRRNKGLLETDIWELFEFTSFPRNWSLTQGVRTYLGKLGYWGFIILEKTLFSGFHFLFNMEVGGIDG